MPECQRCHKNDAAVCLSCVVDVGDDSHKPESVTCPECKHEVLRMTPVAAGVEFVLTVLCPCGARFGDD